MKILRIPLDSSVAVVRMMVLMLRQNLPSPGLWNIVRKYFGKEVTDPRKQGSEKMRDFPIVDVLMSACALFSAKSASLLQFDKDLRTNETIRHNLKTLFGVTHAPSDSQLRDVLDRVDPREIRGVYKKIFSSLQRGKALEQFIYLDDAYLLALDGTGYFSSKKVFCENCCKKEHKDGSTTYYHQMLSGVLVHPDKKAVIPIAPEPIIQQDGSKKNDCERNAAVRFLEDFRREHPHLKVIVTEDGLSSNAPHINLLKDLDLGFILGCKPGDHKSLFDFVNASEEGEDVLHLKMTQNKIQHAFRWMNQVPLNDANPSMLVNFLEYWETKGDKTTHWSWVTHLTLTADNVFQVMKAGRARWAIENETFNTLKNSDYNFEHNFGHGNKNLSVVLALLMMLAFLIDQVQQIACQLFQKAKKRLGTNRELWEVMRSFLKNFRFSGWEEFLSAMAYGIKTEFQIEFESSA